MSDIEGRIGRLSPDARALLRDIVQRGEETGFEVPPDELLVDELPRLEKLFQERPEVREEFLGIFKAVALQARDESTHVRAEAVRHMGFREIIARAQELDRRAGRPVNERLTLGEAISKLEDAGELDLLERGYLDAIKGETIRVPSCEEE